MKPLMLAGALLTALGIIALIFHNGVNYKARETYPKEGESQIVTHQEKIIEIPLAVGGVMVVGGVAMMLLAARR
jgi:hypothetical protein